MTTLADEAAALYRPLVLTRAQRRDLVGLTPQARTSELRSLIEAHEYAEMAKRVAHTTGALVVPTRCEVAHSRRMEAELPALIAAVEGQLREMAA